MAPVRSIPPRRDVQRIVEEQVGRWTVMRKRRCGSEAPAAAKDMPWPIITVSREHGSIGSAVAEETAKLLKYTFWDQELVHLIAKQSGAEEALVASLDEKNRGRVEDFVSRLLVGLETSIADYVGSVGRVARTLERHGSAVVVGRGAQYILDPRLVFRVRVVCPEDIRICRIAHLHRLTQKEAEKAVREVERQRKTFIRKHYDRDIADPNGYDLVVNTGHISIQAAADIVAAAYKVKFPEPKPADVVEFERVPDSVVFQSDAEPPSSTA
jgi:cytidylate kinase